MNRQRNVISMVVLSVLVGSMAVSTGALAQSNNGNIEDEDILYAVETELIVKPALPSQLIDVSVQDGIVTLAGTVENILAKDRAVEVAESIKGVRAVIDQVQVKGTERSDQEIKQDVLTSLVMDPATDSYEVDADVSGGVVTLTGTVESWAEKQLCGEVTKSVKGVREVVNNITYRYERDRPDREIRPEIERRLETSVWIDAGLIDVTVSNGQVTLSGTVGSAAEKRWAGYESWVAGVRSVNTDELEVKWWARDQMLKKERYEGRTDEEIEAAVQDAFRYDPRVVSYRIRAASRGGIVTLTGVVDNLKAKKAAAEDARNTLGVWRVKNLIKVRPDIGLSDEEIAANLQAALQRDVYLDRSEIDVIVYNKTAYLSGSVDTSFERSHAEDVASRVNGVVDVENSLSVRRGWVWKSDLAIEQDVEDELFWSWFVDSDDIDVSVNDGVVTLTGTAVTWREKNAATENAFEGGARDVRNHIVVQYGQPYGSSYYYGPYYGWRQYYGPYRYW